MLKESDVTKFIDSIPPIQKILKDTIESVKEGDLPKAAKAASHDQAIIYYFKNIINKPIFGFRKDLSNMNQIFGALGVQRTKQLLESYRLSLICPKKWSVFSLDDNLFFTLQSECIANWNKVLESQKLLKDEYAICASIIPATVVVCEKLFAPVIEDVNAINENLQLPLNALLQRMLDIDMYQIACRIAEKWEMDATSIRIIELTSGTSMLEGSEEELRIAKLLHLLFFYELSRPIFVEAGLNGFLEFDLEFISDEVMEFNKAMAMEE